MIYLTTGANGAGKTLLTLKNVREQQLKENRPVYYHGFEINEATAEEFGWKTFDPKKWQDLPDGSICIFDECQNEFPAKISGEIPDYINAVAQYRRKRGFDFWMITPHPSMIHLNIRRLIGPPSWHRHIKRAFGADVVSVLKFNEADLKCESPGAGARGEVSMQPYPKEVYGWYKSASIHTGKKKIPRQVYIVGAAIVAVPLMFYLAFKSVYGNVTKHAQPQQQQVAAMGSTSHSSGGDKAAPLTAAEYVKSIKPRIEGFPQTAPRYDEVTKPVIAPYPAACVVMAGDCKCYSQQATLLVVPQDICTQIVQRGYFVDWQLPEPKQTQPAPKPMAENKPQQRSVPTPTGGIDDSDWQRYEAKRKNDEAMQNLAIKNAGPRLHSSLSVFK